jgi:hypothetical protein
MTRIKRPATLHSFGIRLAECIHFSGETVAAWASETCLDKKRLDKLISGEVTMPQADLLLAIDDLAGGSLLTYDERLYAEERYRLNKKNYERRYGVTYWKERR